MSDLDEAAQLAKRTAYLDKVRTLHSRERTIGFVLCLVGVLALAWARYASYAPPWALWVAVGIIAVGWALFAFVLFARSAWVRAHPFDPNG